MNKTLPVWLPVALVCAMASSAYSLTIVPTFDSSITGDPNATAMISGINQAIQTVQSNITDSLTVKILFVNGAVGLGQSETWEDNFSYADYLSALRNHATSIDDANALSQLPNSNVDPIVGNQRITLFLPLARLLGLASGYGPDGYDATITCYMPLINLTRPPTDSNKYDLIWIVEHEMDEVLGLPSALGDNPPSGPVSPIDLFRYTTNLARTWTTAGDDAYFSVDGTNLLARFNQNSAGDYADWWSYYGFWSPPGTIPHGQVQDAFARPGVTEDQGSNELAALDVIGYTRTVTLPVGAPVLSVVQSGVGQLTLSWPQTYSGFALQEKTNLLSGTWTASPSGSSNPAIVTTGGPRKFYRLYKPATASPSNTVAARPLDSATYHVVLHITHPRPL